MKIANSEIIQSLEDGKPLKLDFGSGKNPRQGFYSVDHLDLGDVDIIADLNKPLNQLPNDCADYVYSCHALEHIDKFLPLMQEIHRITAKNGSIEIVVPHFSNVYGYSDPTHVRLFGLYSMNYFLSQENQPSIRRVPSFYTDFRFKLESVTIEFYRSGLIDKILSPLFIKFVNRNMYTKDFYERRLSNIYHAWQIRYLMTPEK